MINKIAGFELRYQIGSPVFIACFAIFFLLAFAGVTIDQVQVGSSGAVNVNSPHAIATNVLIFSLFGLFIPTAFLVSGILRDASFKTEDMFFTTSVKEKDYLLGRFIGGFIVTLLAFASVPAAVMIGAAMPWLDPDNVGPFVPAHYLYHFFVFGALNLLVAGLVMFTVANLTRSNIATYTALVGLLILYFVGLSFADQPELRQTAALLDPFGFNTYNEATRYWTPAEQNVQTPALEGVLLYNRLIWLGAAAALFVLNLFLFSFRRGSGVALGRKKARAAEAPFVPQRIELPRTTPDLSARAARTQFSARVWFEVKGVVLNVAFWVLLALGVLNSIGGLVFNTSLYGTPNYPVTRIMVDTLLGSFSLVPIAVVVYYAAELLWRERNVGFSDIVDATPTPSWAFLFPKFIAMSLVILGLVSVSMLTAIVVQVSRGYTNLELGQYGMRLLFDFGLPFTLLAALSFFAQIVTNNRWLGMLAFILYFIASLVMNNLGFEHNLYQYAGGTNGPYSDMNGYGHFLGISAWHLLYWGAVSAFLLVVSYLLWNRGALTSIGARIARIPAAATPAAVAAIAASLIVAAGSGVWIYYNTVVRNEYVTQKESERRLAEFEKAYRARLENLPQPKIVDVSIDVDIYPRERRYEARGAYVLRNKTDTPIDTVWTDYGQAATIRSQALEGAEIVERDDLYKIYAWKLATPLAPGETRRLDFEVAVLNPGFRNSGNTTTVNYNGTFFNNNEAMPSIGFSRAALLQDKQARRRQGLEPIDRAFPLEDQTKWGENYLGNDADFVTFRSTVSTTPDQIAVAPGYLQREWTENGRRYFEYAMDAPILNFYAWLSADYEVVEDQWNDVKLQVFHHQGHDYNVARMIESMKESLDYFSENFSPFQHRQMRIMEFPAYATFAQSFPNTVPYSEAIGFIADLRDPEDIDYVYYVTAHEVAHQWWAHQVMSANVQGGTMLVETFSQYAALMVMKREYGEEHMRRFLKYELDSYLSDRGAEDIGEQPLYRVENQPYIHYRKGAVVMYALQDYVGEDVVNRAMRRLIELRGFRSDPYATTLDFLKILREEAGPEHEQLIADLFERIVLFDLKIEKAEARSLADGSWSVAIDVAAKRFVADETGAQVEEPIDIAADIGVFTESPDKVRSGDAHVLFREKRRIDQDKVRIEMTVKEKPAFVGVDPYSKLIDRNSDDNLMKVDIVEGDG